MRLPAALLPARPLRLRLLVLAISDRCDQRCVHCAIWMGEPGRRSLTPAEQQRVVGEAIAAGVEQVLLTGGEPLLSPRLFDIAGRLKGAGVRVLLASNGLLLAAHAARIAEHVDELYVSLDGADAATHDGLRGVPSLERVAQGTLALRALGRRPLMVARSTLHARNLHQLAAIVATARRLGFDHASFLALDAASDAFGGLRDGRAALVPSAAQVAGFVSAIDGLEAQGAFRDGFVLEPAEKLRRLAGHLRASSGAQPFERPECDAPWWSTVVEADGSLRPCFFHAPVGDVRDGLVAVRGSSAYTGALAAIRRTNDVCDRCVCPKQRGLSLSERLLA